MAYMCEVSSGADGASASRSSAVADPVGNCLRLTGLAALCLWLGAPVALAGTISDAAPANVTTRAMSIVWVSDEPVTDSDLRIFSDPDGVTDITAGLDVTNVGATLPAASANGIGKIDVSGFTSDTTVYVQLESTTASGTSLWPAAAPLFAVHIASATTRSNPFDTQAPIVNDLVRHVVIDADGVTVAPDTLVLVESPGASGYPLAFVADEQSPGTAETRFDLNNFFDDSGNSLQLAEQAPLRITELHGRRCAGLADQRRIRYRRLRAQSETPAVSSLQDPDLCFLADAVCDGRVDVLDFQFVLDRQGASGGECRFLPELDIVQDDAIDMQDAAEVISSYGQQAPFQ